MDQQLQCPVCTLYLHSGMTLESHLDTHPKDQVIKALCNLSGARSNYGSRSTTPMHSERSYRSRSRTPAAEESRWNSPHTDVDRERYWRTPSRTSRATTNPRMSTPSDLKIADHINFENSNGTQSTPVFSSSTYTNKTSQPYANHSSDLDNHYYINDQPEEEMKYSRSAEYHSNGNFASTNAFGYNVQANPGVRFQTALVPAVPKRHDYLNVGTGTKRAGEFLKLVPKTGNIALVKTNMGSVQYIAPNVKPMHVMMPNTKTFLHSQQNSQNNIIVTGNIAASQATNKPVGTPILSNQFSQMSSASFTPSTTVVTQNSQIIYREMVHNIDGKPFISALPTMLGEDMSKVSQQNSLYQNVMVVDPYGAASCMYAPQGLMPQSTTGTAFNSSLTVTTSNIDKFNAKIVDPNNGDLNRSLVVEVGPIASSGIASISSAAPKVKVTPDVAKAEKSDHQSESITRKGLKILSNIKVEVPVQHHKSLLNTVVDLTGAIEQESYSETGHDDKPQSTPASIEDAQVTNTFSVIKNVGNPPAYRDHKSIESRLTDVESSDSCPVPDLICNEKASISPCSELSESRENSTDNTNVSLKTDYSDKHLELTRSDTSALKSYTSAPLKINSMFVKHKKVLQIKNDKTVLPSKKTEELAIPSTSSSKWAETFTLSKVQQSTLKVEYEKREPEPYLTVDIKRREETDNFDADTEEQSMDIEPVTPSSFQPNVRVKDENCISDAFDHQRDLTPLETIRPVNVISYNLGPDSDGERELLDLEASKTKQFVNMMNDNYFGDNIYADYFTPDRVEAFDADRESYPKDQQKVVDGGVYLWGEPSQKDAYIIPNFIHDSYKLTENATCSNYTLNTDGVLEEELGEGELEGDGEVCERDSKVDVLSESRSMSEMAVDISADERMPPRGELSGQESNGDMDAPWSGAYQDVATSASYDLMAREAWLSDGSDVDAAEKRDNLDDDAVRRPRGYQCVSCDARFGSVRELRAHRLDAHPLPAGATYQRLVAARAIKKELKAELVVLPDSKASMGSLLGAYEEALAEAKPKLEATIVKQETKRRRRDYVCPTCKVDQHNEVQFHLHLKIHPLECLTCGKCFFRRANLALHIRIHLGIRNYKCEVCEKRFLTRQKLQEHHNIHTGRAPVKCTLCDEMFRRHSNMIQHRNRHHLHLKKKIRDFVCQCGEVFHSRRKLMWHRETHDDRPKACPYCSDKFVHAASLTRHVRRAHNSYYVPDERRRAENVPCPICKQIYLKTNIEVHIQTHTGKKPHQCVICSKSFTTKWNLKLHRWTHMSRSSKPFKCHLCKGAFIRQNEYVSHMNAHKSVRPYTCNYCGCQFIRKYNCQRHVREHEMAKRYVCKVAECGKSFHRSYYLTEHMRVHSGARPFACSMCGKTSSNKSNHNKHLKIHHTREPVATEA